MSAVVALTQARAAGIKVKREGNDLMLEASDPPPVAVVILLKQNKDAILTLLDLKDGCSDEDWESLFAVGDPGALGFYKQLETEIAKEDRVPMSQVTVFETDQWKGGKGGEGGVFEVLEPKVLIQAQSDPCPNAPWPQPGETLLPGWGTRVSMEYRLRTASEEECLEWAKEQWQLELVAKARGYSAQWSWRIARNRAAWKEIFASRDRVRHSS